VRGTVGRREASKHSKPCNSSGVTRAAGQEEEEKKRGCTGVLGRRGVTLVCSGGYAATDTWNTTKLRTAQLRLSLLRRRGGTVVCSGGYAATDTWNTRKLRTAQLRLSLLRRRGVTLVCSSGYAATDNWNTRKLRTAQLRLSLLRLNPKKSPGGVFEQAAGQ
jgi:osmotically-inducible protein OsmY